MKSPTETNPAPFNAELFREFAKADQLLKIMSDGKPDIYLEALFNTEVRENSVTLRKWNEFVQARTGSTTAQLDAKADAACAQLNMWALARVVYAAVLDKLNECRRKCPGIGGDVDAMNLRRMIEGCTTDDGAFNQAVATLERLAKSLDVDATHAIVAARSLPRVNRACNLNRELVLFVEKAERRAKYIAGMDPNDSRIPRLLDEQREAASLVLQAAKGGA